MWWHKKRLVAVKSEEKFLIKAIVHECTELALKIVNLGFEIFEIIIELSLKSHLRVISRSNQFQFDVHKTILTRRQSELYVLKVQVNEQIIIYEKN